MTNLTLRKKDTTTNDFCYLVIKGDVNDSDYIEESTLLNNKELDEQVGKQKEVQNKQVKSVDRFTNYLNKIDLSSKPAEYVSPLKKDR